MINFIKRLIRSRKAVWILRRIYGPNPVAQLRRDLELRDKPYSRVPQTKEIY